MNRSLFAYYDHVTESYRAPFINDDKSDVMATNISRSIKFNLETNNYDAVKGLDYCSLFELGSFDDEKGCLISLSQPVLVIDCRLIFDSYRKSHETKNFN